MTDIDPRDYIDTYVVEVKRSIFVDTSLSRDELDSDSYDSILSSEMMEDSMRVEFTTRMVLERLVEEWNQELNFLREGEIRIQEAHPTDESDTDAYLLFMR